MNSSVNSVCCFESTTGVSGVEKNPCIVCIYWVSSTGYLPSSPLSATTHPISVPSYDAAAREAEIHILCQR